MVDLDRLWDSPNANSYTLRKRQLTLAEMWQRARQAWDTGNRAAALETYELINYITD